MVQYNAYKSDKQANQVSSQRERGKKKSGGTSRPKHLG